MYRKIYLTKAEAVDAAAKYAEIRDARCGRETFIDDQFANDCEEDDRFAAAIGSWCGTLSAVAVDKGADTIAEFGWWCEDDEEFVEGFLERQDDDAKYTVTKVEWHDNFGIHSNEATYIFAIFHWEGKQGNDGMAAALINVNAKRCWTIDDWQQPTWPISVSECEGYDWRDFENREDVSGSEILAKATER